MVGSTSAPQLPGYRDLAPLGRGGYSEVYSAYQEQFDRWVAVKVLTFALTDDRAQRRFLRECRVAGRLSAHPNIVTVYDAGLSPDGRPYISMELFDRGSIADQLRSGGPFGVADVLHIAVGLAGALETAHRAGVVHRDVKPANVLLASYGQPALTDFGLSILAERQEVSVGVDALTPYHAPPEVLERTTVTPTSDVYSLASTTYAMLAGRAPHQRGGDQDTMASLLLRILQVDVPPTGREDVPGSLDTALRAALARDAHVRTPSALAFAQALQQVQAELGLEVTRPIVMEGPQNSEVAAPPGAVFDPSPAALTVPTDSPGPAVRREQTLDYGAARPGEATVDRPIAAGGAAPGLPPSGGSGPMPDAGPAAGAFAPGGVGSPAAPGFVPNGPGPGGPGPGGAPQGLGNPGAAPAPHGRPGPGGPPPALGGPGGAPGALAPPMAGGPGGPAHGFGNPGAGPDPHGGQAPGGPPPAFGGPPGPQGPQVPPAGPSWSPYSGGPGGQLDADETVHRDVVRRARAEEPPEKPSKLRRRLLIAAAVLVLAGAGVGTYLALQAGDDEEADPRPDRTTTTTSGEPRVLDVPTGLTATVNQAGVHLQWNGDNAEQYVVLLMPEGGQPQLLPATVGANRLVEETALRPNVGYCFAVAMVSTLEELTTDQAAEAFSAPACIRGASEDTVVTGSGDPPPGP